MQGMISSLPQAPLLSVEPPPGLELLAKGQELRWQEGDNKNRQGQERASKRGWHLGRACKMAQTAAMETLLDSSNLCSLLEQRKHLSFLR